LRKGKLAILGYKNSFQGIRACGLAKWLETHGLAGWLEVATDGLEAPARRRIACEIEAHFTEAVSAHLAKGEPVSSAQSTALAELGDPQKAALKFRKTYLTESEAKSIKWMEWTAAKGLFSFWAPLLDGIPLAVVALFYFHVRRNGDPRLLLDFHFYAGFLLVSYVGLRLIPRLLWASTLRRNFLLRGLALCQFTTRVVVVPAIWLVPFMHDHDTFAALNLIFFFFVYGFVMNPGFRIWNKLRKMGEGAVDPPPRQTSAS
jgi:hypothetical protein